MPPRIYCSTRSCVSRTLQRTTSSTRPTAAISQTSRIISRNYASAPTSTVPLSSLKLPDNYVPPTQPPSARRPDQRKSQLLRSYTAMLRATPLMLFFQHNNVAGVEWAAIRRELRAALASVPGPIIGPPGSEPVDLSSHIELQVLRTRMFTIALKIVEFFKPEDYKGASNAYTHDLSATAYEAISKAAIEETSVYAQISPLLIGPTAAVSLPIVSPAHLAAVLSVLSPSPPAFPAPTRKKRPGYYEPTVQNGLQKLVLIGGRIESKVFDYEGVKWVGGIEGGVDGLRSQLVAMLQSAGLSLTTALQGHGKDLWLSLESRRIQLDEQANGGAKKEEEGKGEESKEST